MTHKKNFCLPKLTQGKVNYVYYRYRHPITGKMVPFKFYKGLNNIPQDIVKERAKRLINSLTTSLQSGFNPFDDIYSNEELSLFDSKDNWLNCLDDFLTFKRTENLEEDSLKAYRFKIEKFIKYLKLKNWEKLHVSLFSYDHAVEFFNWLSENGCQSSKTLKEYKSLLGQASKHLKKRKLINENVFELLPNYKYEAQKPKLFTDEEILKIKDYCLKNEKDVQLWTIMQFIFYCFFRPHKEVRLMRVKQIDFKNSLLWAKPESAKNNKRKAVIIPDHFLYYLKHQGYENYPPDYYMFTINGHPGTTPLGKNYITKHYNIVRKLYNIDTYLYAAKHTGNRKLKDNKADIIDIMKQNRHSNLNQTWQYLKSLEDDFGEDLKNKFCII